MDQPHARLRPVPRSVDRDFREDCGCLTAPLQYLAVKVPLAGVFGVVLIVTPPATLLMLAGVVGILVSVFADVRLIGGDGS